MPAPCANVRRRQAGGVPDNSTHIYVGARACFRPHSEGQAKYAWSLEETNPAEAYAWHEKLIANPGARPFGSSAEKFVREYDEEQAAVPGAEFAIRRRARTGDTAAMIEYAKRIAPKNRNDMRKALELLQKAEADGNADARRGSHGGRVRRVLAGSLFPGDRL